MQAEWRIHLLFTAPRARCRGKVCWFTSADRARLSNASLFVHAPSSQRGAPTMTCRSARSVTPAAVVVRTRHGALGLAWPEPVRCVGMPCRPSRQTDSGATHKNRSCLCLRNKHKRQFSFADPEPAPATGVTHHCAAMEVAPRAIRTTAVSLNCVLVLTLSRTRSPPCTPAPGFGEYRNMRW